MTKKLMLLLAAVMVAVTAMAVSAYPEPMTMTQPDGSQIVLRLVGDEYYHYWLDEQGHEVQRDSLGYWQVVGPAPTIQTIAARRAANPMRTNRAAARRVGTPVACTRVLVILVQYQDVTFQTSHNRTFFANLLSSQNYTASDGAVGSVRDYFYDQSYGQYDPQFDVVGPVTLSQNRAYYGANNEKGSDLRPGEMVNEACALANSNFDVDFTQYDGNNDGVVDLVYVIYAGGGAADGGPEEAIWPHSWSLAGANIPKENRTYDGKSVNKYACACELVKNESSSTPTIGTFCHELSHVIGLPDCYDIDYGKNYQDCSTPGFWSLMDRGNYINDGRTPAPYSTFDRYFMGWATPENLGTTARTITLPNIMHRTAGVWDGMGVQLNSSGTLAAYSATTVQYYLENRQTSKWGSSTLGHGLLIWRVEYDQTAWDKNGPNDVNDVVRYTVVSASGETTAIGVGVYNGVTVRGRDPFPGTTGRNWWNGVPGREIYNIVENETTGEVSFAYMDNAYLHALTLGAEADGEHYATFSSSEAVQFIDETTTACAALLDETDPTKLVFTALPDRKVPANTGVLLKSSSNTANYVTIPSAAALSDNLLQPGTGALTAGEDCKFYRLAYYDYTAKTGLGFYYGPGCTEGEAFTCRAGSAYLAVPASLAPARFVFNETQTPTGLTPSRGEYESVKAEKVMIDGRICIIRGERIYDITGRQVQ